MFRERMRYGLSRGSETKRRPSAMGRRTKGAPTMSFTRRHVVIGAMAAPAVIASTRFGAAAPAKTLKISHQFPGSSGDEGDFRDRLCRKFAAELEKRTDGQIAAQVYPGSSLM